MKRLLLILLCLGLTLSTSCAEEGETHIRLDTDAIYVNDAMISEDENASVYLVQKVENHSDVPNELKDLSNRVVTITEGGVYRIFGTAQDTQIAVRAEDSAEVRLILDGVDLSCRTAPAIAIYTAADPREANEYGVTIELADGSTNQIVGSHAKDEELDVKLSGAISSLVSIGFEGSGSLNVDADEEGIEVKFGHMTINGGSYIVQAADDPINISEDGVGVLTINDGYVFTSVKNVAGGEGDGIDSNGYIEINGGTVIALAHPSSADSGIDSDMGSRINGGIVVGAGNMYDPIEEDSEQLFMMLEFSENTDDLLVVTDQNDCPIFAYDFPYSYRYIAFSTSMLEEDIYRVYLGGEIEGEQTDGLYTSITSYTPGQRMQHGAENLQGEMGDNFPEMPPKNDMPMDGRGEATSQVDLNELLADVDLNELLAGKDLNQLLYGFKPSDLLTDEQMQQAFGDAEEERPMQDAPRMDRMSDDVSDVGRNDPHRMASSGEVASGDFHLSESDGEFSNVCGMES